MEDVTISLRDLLLRILLKWRTILVCVLLGAVLLNCFGIYRAQRRNAAARRAAESTVTLESLAGKLTDEELETAMSNAPVYRGLYDLMSRSGSYMEHSIRMQLDPNAVPTLRTKLLVEAEDSARTGAILSAAEDRLASGDLYEVIARLLGDAESASYISELIYIQENAVEAEDLGDVLDIRITARSEEECRRINDLLLERLEEVTPELRETCGPFSFQFLGSEFAITADALLLTSHQTMTNLAKNALDNYTKYVATFSADQLVYLNALTVGIEESDASVSPAETAGHVRLFLPKYVLVGAVAGVLAAAVWIYCSLLLGGRLVTPESISVSSGVPVLGTVRVSRKPRGLDRWFRRLLDRNETGETPEECLAMTAAGIRIAAEKNGWKSVYLTGTSQDDETNATISRLAEQLKGQVDVIRGESSVRNDPAALEAMSASDAAVLVERVDVSRHADIQKALALCRQYKIPVAGFVTQI